MTTQQIIAEGQQYVMNTYARFPYVFERGEGAYLYDKEGKKYLDFVAGIAVNALGYSNERLLQAIETQSRAVLHTSNLFWIEQQVELAKLLVEHSCFDQAFFCNSGAEANEAAMKLARKYGSQESKGDRHQIISMVNSFHGRTYGAITATGQFKYQKGIGQLLPDIVYADFNDFDSVLALAGDKSVAVLMELVQGEGGVLPADPEFVKKVRSLCDERDMLLIIDEVQTGIGRTGTLFAYEQYGIEPDVISLAKGLGGGVPIGAILAKKRAADAFHPGDHAATFGGNHLSCAAGVAVLKEIEEKDLLTHVSEVGAYLKEGNQHLMDKYPDLIEDVRGLGLMQGIALKDPAMIVPIREACAEEGLLIISAGKNVLRMVPPLIITKEQIDTAEEILDHAFAKISQ